MKKKKAAKHPNILVRLITLIPTILSFSCHFVAMLEEDARLARRSFISILILSVVIGALLTTFWIVVLALLFIYLVSLKISAIAALVMILILNFLLLIIAGLLTLREKDRLLFPATRQFIRHIK